MNLRAIVLDTNHISDLALRPQTPGSVDLTRRLQDGLGQIALSLLQVLELSNPAFRGVEDVKALLSDVPTILANPTENVQNEEIACAIARAAGLSRRPPRVFARDTSEWGYHTGPSGGTAVDMIDAFASLPAERHALRAVAEFGAESSMLKSAAALMKNPLLPLTLAIEHHLNERRRSCSEYGGGLSPISIIDAVGGKTGFPGYYVQESLVAERLKDTGQKSSANDVFDEYIAFHSPYAAVTATDRRTYHRARMAKLPHLERMTRDLSEVSSILDRVVGGDLAPLGSAF